MICGLISSIVTATKVVHFGINFPFSNIVFSIFTYPIVDCICELWGKRIASQTLCLALFCQLFVAIILQISILVPAASFWQNQDAYQLILGASKLVFFASLLAFSASQLLDIVIYQQLKIASNGKYLWLRSILSTFLGQTVDSIIFISIVFQQSQHKFNMIFGSVSVKIFLSLAMTPIIYAIVILINRYLDNNTLAFKSDAEYASNYAL